MFHWNDSLFLHQICSMKKSSIWLIEYFTQTLFFFLLIMLSSWKFGILLLLTYLNSYNMIHTPIVFTFLSNIWKTPEKREYKCEMLNFKTFLKNFQ